MYKAFIILFVLMTIPALADKDKVTPTVVVPSTVKTVPAPAYIAPTSKTTVVVASAAKSIVYKRHNGFLIPNVSPGAIVSGSFFTSRRGWNCYKAVVAVNPDKSNVIAPVCRHPTEGVIMTTISGEPL